MSGVGLRRGGVLLLITGMLALSGLLRLGDTIGDALALEAAPASVDGCSALAGTEDLLAALRRRETRVRAQEEEIAARMQALTLADQGARARLAELQSAEAALAATMARAETAADADVTRLVAVYEAMKPKEAAALFSEMEPQFAAGFLGRMKPEAAAAVMAGLPPKTAYSFSVLLAGRNAAAPKD